MYIDYLQQNLIMILYKDKKIIVGTIVECTSIIRTRWSMYRRSTNKIVSATKLVPTEKGNI